jgi:hypothetical protein
MLEAETPSTIKVLKELFQGNYGAGTVIIWDRGTYEPVEKAPTKREQERLVTKTVL